MSNQTESYIVLKPIAERFTRVASEITDEHEMTRGTRLKLNIYEDACVELSKEEIDKVITPFVNVNES